MKTQTPIALHQIVDQLVLGLLPRTARQKSLIINDIKEQMFVSTDNNMVASVLGCLLNTTVDNTQNNCIRISAKLFGNITLVHVKNNDISHQAAITKSLSQIQPLAQKLGGCISITNNKVRGTTVAFTFNTNQQAA
jgi:hypothetical protein